MKKFLKIESLHIKMKEGQRTLFINKRKIHTYDSSGALFLASEIESLLVEELANLHPIVIEMDEDYIKNAGVPHLENKVVSIRVLDKDSVEVFPTVVTPWDINEKGLHEQYQEILETLVKEDKRFISYLPVRSKLTKAETKKLDAQKEKHKNSTTTFNYSEVGDLQFLFYAEINTFDEALQVTNRIVANLDKKARAALKRKK